MVTRNGEMAEVITEGETRTRGLGDFLQGLVWRGPDVQVLVADTSPFKLSFWLEDLRGLERPEESMPFGMHALTADGQLITAQVNLKLSFVPQLADRPLRLLRGRRAIGTFDVARLIKDEMLAKVIALELGKHSAGELRRSDGILRSIYESLKVELDSNLSRYGIRLVSFYINWGVSEDEREKIEEQRHQARVSAAQR